MRRLIIGLLMSLGSFSAFGCGGALISQEVASDLPEIKIYQEKFEAATGEKLLLEEVVFSKNEILNYEKQVVARTMCAAEYINAYFRSSSNPITVCQFIFQVDHQGRFKNSQFQFNGSCRLQNGSQVGIK